MQIDDYLGLIPPYYSSQPRFMNMLAALLQPLADAQEMLAKLTVDFDIDTAIGVQLDQVGQWVGRNRYIRTPITGVFFSFDLPTQRVGFDQGVWLGKYDPTDAITTLDDNTYRSVLKLQVIANSWDGTLISIADAINAVFPNIVIQDRGDTPTGLMSMDILIPSTLFSTLLLSVIEQDFPIKPGGVRVNFIETTGAPTEPVFAFDVPATPGGPMGGFDQAAWGIIVFTV